MPLLIRCPNGHRLSVPSQRAGQVVSCPICGTKTQVPDKSVVEAAKSRLLRKEETSGTVNGKASQPPSPPPIPKRQRAASSKSVAPQDPRSVNSGATTTAGDIAEEQAATVAGKPGATGDESASPTTEKSGGKPPPLPQRGKRKAVSQRSDAPPKELAERKPAAKTQPPDPADGERSSGSKQRSVDTTPVARDATPAVDPSASSPKPRPSAETRAESASADKREERKADSEGSTEQRVESPSSTPSEPRKTPHSDQPAAPPWGEMPANWSGDAKGNTATGPAGKGASKPVAGKLRSKSKKSRWRGEPTEGDQDQAGEQQPSPQTEGPAVAGEGASEKGVPTKRVAEAPAAKDRSAGPKGPDIPKKPGSGPERPDRSKGRRKPVDLMADTAEVDVPAAVADGVAKTSQDRGGAAVAGGPAESSEAKDAAFAAMSAASATAGAKGPPPIEAVAAASPAAERDADEVAEMVAAERDADEVAEMVAAERDAEAAPEVVAAELVTSTSAGISADAASAPPESPAPTAATAREVAPANTPAPPVETALAAEPEPPPQPGAPPMPPPVGIVHPPAKRLPVYYLAAGLAGVAAVSLFPALREVLLHFISENSPGIDLWAPVVILLGVVQLAYVVYAVQVPDWGSTRVLMVVSVVIAMFYAMVLGISVMAQDDNSFVLSLGLTSEYHLKQITAWCFLMLVLMCTLAYFWARTTFRWRRTSQQSVAGSG